MVTIHSNYQATSQKKSKHNIDDSNGYFETIGDIRKGHNVVCEGERAALCNGDAERAKGHGRNGYGVKDGSITGTMMMTICRLYIVLGIFFGGICVGFTIGFYLSTSYWHSDSGKLRSASMKNNYNNDKKYSEQAAPVDLPISDMVRYGTFEPQSPLGEMKVLQKEPLMGFSLLNLNNGDNGNSGPPALVYLHHAEAYSLLLSNDNNGNDDIHIHNNDDTVSLTSMLSRYSLPYFLITSGWDVQKNQAYCAVATATATLNSLRFLDRDSPSIATSSLPTDPVYRPFAYATQTDIFNPCTNHNVIYMNDAGINDGVLTPPFGLSMLQMADLFRQCYFHNGNSVYGDVDIHVQHVDHTHLTLAKMRFDLMNALEDKNARVMINYNRQLVGQLGGGHWSPLAAYSPSMDAFLVMDVAKYKYPPVWIPTTLLYNSMGTKDPCGNWDYPHAQTKLNQQERLSLTPQHYQQAMKKLNCQPVYRGYIILTFD